MLLYDFRGFEQFSTAGHDLIMFCSHFWRSV